MTFFDLQKQNAKQSNPTDTVFLAKFTFDFEGSKNVVYVAYFIQLYQI